MKTNVKKYIIQSRNKLTKWNKRRQKRKVGRVKGRQQTRTAIVKSRRGGKTARVIIRQEGKTEAVSSRQRNAAIRKAGRPSSQRKMKLADGTPAVDTSFDTFEEMDYGDDYGAGGGMESYGGEESITDAVWFWPAVGIAAVGLFFTMNKKKKGA